MSDPQLPGIENKLVTPSGNASTPFYRWFQFLSKRVLGVETTATATAQAVAEIVPPHPTGVFPVVLYGTDQDPQITLDPAFVDSVNRPPLVIPGQDGEPGQDSCIPGPKGDKGEPGAVGVMVCEEHYHDDSMMVVGASVDTSAFLTSASIVDSIADSDTDHAPSRNAVFDALALKQPLDTQLTSLAALAYTGNALKVVRVNAGETDFELAAASSGDFVGPGSSTDNAIVRFDTTTGKLGQNSALTVSDVSGSSVSLASTAGNALAVAATAPTATTGASQAGKAASVTASDAVASTDTAGAAAGGSVTLTGGAAARNTSGNANGGDVNLTGGAGIGTGTAGQVNITQAGAAGAPALTMGGDTGVGWWRNTTSQWTWGNAGNARVTFSGTIVRLGSAGNLGWSSTSASTGTTDTGIERNAARVVEVNNGTTGSYGDLVVRAMNLGAAAGAATSQYEMRKVVSSIANNTATDVLTITIPNAAHSGQLYIELCGSLGAGGAIGANEASATNCYTVTFTRTAGVNAVATISAASGASACAVAGAATVTCVGTLSAVSGAVGASNTFTIKVTIARSGGSSTNHTCQVYAKLVNANATGMSIA